MNKTGIQWTNYTLQLVRFRSKLTGRAMNWCQKISRGCTACYAERITRRFHGAQHSYTPAGSDLVEPFLDRDALRELVTTQRSGLVFVEDMSDLFGGWVPNAWLDECFAAFALSPLTIQVLTKRAERMRAYVADPKTPRRVMARKMARMCEPSGVGTRVCVDVPAVWPLPNVWLGVSVEDRANRSRLDRLRETPAAVRFVSFEPLLQDLGALDLRGIHWAIFGGESGPKARPCNVAWIRSIRDQCRAAGVACFVKQLGAHVIADAANVAGFRATQLDAADYGHGNDRVRVRLKDSHGGDPAEWPEDLRVRELPQTAASPEDAQPHRRQSRRSAPAESNGATTVHLHRGRPRRSRGAA